MRADVDEIKRGGYRFVMEVDTGGNGIEYICWVYNEDGSELRNEDGWQVRKNFGHSYKKAHFNNFVNKFINDKTYREKYFEN